MAKKIILILIALLAVFVVLPFGIAIYLYRDSFGGRFETYEPYALRPEDFPGLQRERHLFASNLGQILTGYFYTHENVDFRGAVVMAHGFGAGGHTGYMDAANYFAKNGYLVFAYDATGNDESEGDSVRGFPQQVIDLDYAIREVQAREPKLPIVLFGHSWGGYTVANELNLHPEVRAIIALSGFNNSLELLESEGKKMVGKLTKILMPYVGFLEKRRFGEYSTNSAISGFEHSDAAIMIIGSEIDESVPNSYGYDKYFEKYADSPRFRFIKYKDRRHNQIYYSDEAREKIHVFEEAMKAHFGDQTPSPTEKAEYVREHLDREAWANCIDEELFKEMLTFYDNATGGTR